MLEGHEEQGAGRVISLTWGHSGGNGGRGRGASPRRSEGGHLDGVGGEGGQALDFILVRRAVESVCEPRVALPVHLPGELVACRASRELVQGLPKATARSWVPHV